MEGSTIGQYHVVRKLGEGGMGAVYMAEHTLLGRKAAIKVLLKELSTNESIVQRFFNEARAVTAIADPGIVQVFDFGHHTDGSAYIVMELLDGEAMDTRLKRIGRFAPVDAVRLMAQIASSLGAAHAKGVIHRDLKPENIFIVPDPAVAGGERSKILDFGIAKLHGDDAGRMKTRTGMVMGTPVYMSPEQCRGASNLDHRSDIYALGCVLFTMVCGRPPFEAESSGELIVAHIRDVPPRPTAFVPALPLDLEAIILRCLEKEPATRFQTTADLAAALMAVEAQLYGLTPEMMEMVAGQGGYAGMATPAMGAYKRLLTPSGTPGMPIPGVTTRSRGGTAPPPGAHPGTHPGPITTPPGASPTAQTTLGSAAGEAAPAPKKKTGLLVGLGVVLAGGIGAAVVLAGGGGGSQAADAPPSAVGSAAVAAPTPTPTPAPVDAAMAATTPDAAPVETAATDAGVAPVVDAGEAVATTPVDAGATTSATPPTTTKTTTTRRGGTKRGGGKQGGTNGTQTGTGTVDRGD